MQFAVNYSPLLAELVRAGQVHVDRFKCPDWPDLLAQASEVSPVYIHFPLLVGNGQGGPIDGETEKPADLERIAGLLESTGTPLVNTHFSPSGKHYVGVPLESREPRHIQQVIDNTLRDLEPLIRRFGAERVMLENLISGYGWLTLAALPEVIHRVLEESGVGFLFDLSHARLSARNLGLDERDYCSAMPVKRIREIHVTGLQILEGELVERMTAAGNPGGFFNLMIGRWMDHLPMTAQDWPPMEWMMGEIHAGRWGTPWVVSSEVGGVGEFWDSVMDREAYLEQVPRMEALVKGNSGA